MAAEGYRQLGEKYGQVYYERVVLDRDWQQLQPTAAERNGVVIRVHFHVPVSPLVWETTFQTPHQSIAEWKEGKDFEVNTAAGAKVTIASVAISGDAVIVTCESDPGPNAQVGYAMIGNPPDGGSLQRHQHWNGAANYVVAFEMQVTCQWSDHGKILRE